MSANVQMGSLGQSVATIETEAVLSSLATMEDQNLVGFQSQSKTDPIRVGR